jgi:glycosyltransferase involved in cell wall biosynthesis
MERTAVKLSVVICTYNPADNIFGECLDAVKLAASGYAPHEILIVDNNSSVAVAERECVKQFLGENSNSRVVTELKQGLTPARLKGLRESSGDLIIFVDDDNLLDANYFESAVAIYFKCPFIGAYSGQVSLKYESEPATWTKKYWGMLIYRRLEKDVWSNVHFNNDTMPNGAGLCISRDVAEHYLRLFDEGKRNFNLDRSKGSLMSGGDNDLAMCACDIGKGMGLFKALHLQHHIPDSRFTLEYLSRLAYGIYFSYAILLFMRTGQVDKETISQRIKYLIRISIMKRKDRIIQQSCKKGLKDAIGLIGSETVKTK